MTTQQHLMLSESTQPQANGIVCRVCGCQHMYVYRTVNQHNKIIRYRKCRHCGNTITSIERVLLKNPKIP